MSSETEKVTTELKDEQLDEAAGGIVFVGGYGSASYQYANETTYSPDEEPQRECTEKSARE